MGSDSFKSVCSSQKKGGVFTAEVGGEGDVTCQVAVLNRCLGNHIFENGR